MKQKNELRLKTDLPYFQNILCFITKYGSRKIRQSRKPTPRPQKYLTDNRRWYEEERDGRRKRWTNIREHVFPKFILQQQILL